MNDFETPKNAQSHTITRRVFLGTGVAALAGFSLFSRRKAPVVQASGASAGTSRPVTVVKFGDDGSNLGKQTIPKLVKTEAEWKQQLSGNAYDIARGADTEMAYTGSTWNEHNKGIFHCICCDLALFSSKTKFDSGTGWPSFWAPLAKENVIEVTDSSLGMERTEVKCKLCDAHLGHVFNDGPPPTGLRYCMNSASMHFVKA